MKRFVPIAWYALAGVSLVGLWLGWSWFSEPLWPLVCILTGRLSRYELKLEPTVFDRAFKSRWLERFAMGSIAAMMIGITGWFLYLKYVSGPAAERAGVAEYLQAREAMMRDKLK